MRNIIVNKSWYISTKIPIVIKRHRDLAVFKIFTKIQQSHFTL